MARAYRVNKRNLDYVRPLLTDAVFNSKNDIEYVLNDFGRIIQFFIGLKKGSRELVLKEGDWIIDHGSKVISVLGGLEVMLGKLPKDRQCS